MSKRKKLTLEDKKAAGEDYKAPTLASKLGNVQRDDLPVGNRIPILEPCESPEEEDENLKEERERIENLRKVLPGYAKYIGCSLKDKENLDVLKMDMILKNEEKSIATINSVEIQGVRRELALAFLVTLVETMPEDAVGLNHLTDVGWRLEYFEESNSRYFKLPLTNKQGRWEWKWLVGANSDLNKKIRKIETAVHSKYRAEKTAKLEVLKDGASTDLLETLEQGGEVFFYAPADKGKKPDGKPYYYPGGHIRISVEDGEIRPIGAVGGCQQLVKNALAFEVFLPVESLREERLILGMDMPDYNQRMANYIFHSTCRRAYLEALAMHERETAADADPDLDDEDRDEEDKRQEFRADPAASVAAVAALAANK